MTFDQIWERLARKKPALEQDDSVVTFTSANLRQLLRQVYDQGEASSHDKAPAGNPFSDLFGGFRR